MPTQLPIWCLNRGRDGGRIQAQGLGESQRSLGIRMSSWWAFQVGLENTCLSHSLLHSKSLLSGQTCRASEPVLSSGPAASDFLGPSSFSPHHHWGRRGLLTKFTHFGGLVRYSHKRANVYLHLTAWQAGFPGGSVVKNPPASAGDVGLIPGSGRSPGEGNGHPLQYSCLGNPKDREAWWATVHGVAESDMI